MAGRHSKRGKGHRVETPDLELMPMLNVFISIIPMLLLSAAFVQLAVIDTGLPTPAGAPAAVASDPSKAAPAPILVRVHGADWIVENAPGGTRVIPRGRALQAPSDPGRLQLQSLLLQCAAGDGAKPEVRIVPEPGTAYDEIIFLMDLARTAGLPHAALADAPGAA